MTASLAVAWFCYGYIWGSNSHVSLIISFMYWNAYHGLPQMIVVDRYMRSILRIPFTLCQAMWFHTRWLHQKWKRRWTRIGPTFIVDMYLLWRLKVNPTVCVWHHAHVRQFEPHGTQVGVAGEAVTAVEWQGHLALHLVPVRQGEDQVLSPLNVTCEAAHGGLSLPLPPVRGQQAWDVALTPCLRSHMLRWRKTNQRVSIYSIPCGKCIQKCEK